MKLGENLAVSDESQPEKTAETLPQRNLSEYLAHQLELAWVAFRIENPTVIADPDDNEASGAVMMWWVARGYAGAFGNLYNELRKKGEDRFPELEELHPERKDQDRDVIGDVSRTLGGQPIAWPTF